MRALHDHERPPALAAAAPTRRAWRSPPTCRRPAHARTLPARLIATLLLFPGSLRSKYIVICLAAQLRALVYADRRSRPRARSPNSAPISDDNQASTHSAIRHRHLGHRLGPVDPLCLSPGVRLRIRQQPMCPAVDVERVGDLIRQRDHPLMSRTLALGAIATRPRPRFHRSAMKSWHSDTLFVPAVERKVRLCGGLKTAASIATRPFQQLDTCVGSWAIQRSCEGGCQAKGVQSDWLTWL